MEGRFNEDLSNLLLVQKSINHVMPYDAIEQIIHSSIESIKQQNINARISNVVFNINGKLTLAQIYVERKNAFAVTKDNKFGTSPTAYNVQVRFPFGLETSLGQRNIILPAGGFNHALQPYKNHNRKITDDVQRDSSPKDLICGPNVEKKISDAKDQIILRALEGEDVTLSYSDAIGKGYEVVPISLEKEYYELADYNSRLKMNGLYPLFYSGEVESKTVLREHPEYPGYTIYQQDYYEPRAEYKERLPEYKTFISKNSSEITEQKVGKRWIGLREQSRSKYVLDISIINGVTLYTQSGLPVTRLRDYQLELFQSCLTFIEQVEAKPKFRHAGKINMGVGAGKTFFTFTFLQHLKYKMQTANDPTQIKPPFCMAPDIEVANVTKRSIDRQGVTCGTSAIAITKSEQMPNPDFISIYETISHHAQEAAKEINVYIQNGLQEDILIFCYERSYHPLTLINLLYNRYSGFQLTPKVATFKDSIDVKRLLLMVEGQKVILNKTGMLGIEALSNLLDQFTAIRQGIKNNYEFKESKVHQKIKQLKINYNQTVFASRIGSLNIATVTSQRLLEILKSKHKNNLRAIRETLMRIACLANKDAAVLLANSGGLGNTYTIQELEKQISDFLPIAVTQLTTLAQKKEHNCHDHYLLYLYLNEIFSTIPDGIRLNYQLDSEQISRDDFQNELYQESINFNLQLIPHIENRISDKIKALGKISELKLNDTKASNLLPWGIQPSDNPINAANQLAGIASLGITGHASSDDAKLLLSHIPVFTPEGLASYVEYLSRLKGQPKLVFKEEFGVYKITTKGKITKKDIIDRLQQFLNSIMIGDEVHKEEFNFLYDKNNSIYRRINVVTRSVLGKEFCEVLPSRIGMSGTINPISDKAFGKTTLYYLSTQKMIEQGLVKQVSISTQSILSQEKKEESKQEDLDSLKKNKQAYAKQIVVDYFVQNSNLSIKNLLNGKNYAIDLFEISKSLIFSKIKDEELNSYIAHYFNLLIQEKFSEIEDQETQAELFERINEQRKMQDNLLRGKLRGELPLTEAECVQIEIYNRASSHNSIQTTKDQYNKIKIAHNIKEKKAETVLLTPKILQTTHRNMFLNNLFAIYLEYVLSKSNSPKEFSDIVGLQNKLYEDGETLITGLQHEQAILSLMQAVDPRSMTKEDISSFINARIKDTALAMIMINGITQHKNDANKFSSYLRDNTLQFPLKCLVTSERHEFEAGKTLAMLGSEGEQTGYSHEPVGIIVDASCDNNIFYRLNSNIEKIKEGKFQPTDVASFFSSLQTLAETTFSYDEKNQAGGRALRTPYGHVKYAQYLSNINLFLAKSKGEYGHGSPLEALKVETQFEDIFTANEDLAQQERASITFNRFALSLLKGSTRLTPANFSQAIANHFAEQLRDDRTKNQYEHYIRQRLPLLWAMKYEPNLACEYFNTKNASIFDSIRSQFTFVLSASLMSLYIASENHEEKEEEDEKKNLTQKNDGNSSEIKETRESIALKTSILSNPFSPSALSKQFIQKEEKKKNSATSFERKEYKNSTPSHRQKLGQPRLLTHEFKCNEEKKAESLLQEAPDEIIPNLFLVNGTCGDQQLTSLAEKKENSDFVILRCTTHPIDQEIQPQREYLEQTEFLKVLAISDLKEEDISKHFDDCFNFIDQALQKKKKVLVHCAAGASRSPTIVAAYLIRKYGLTAKEAINHIQNKRPCVDTGNFSQQLEQYENSPNVTLIKGFLSRHEASYRSGCSCGFFSLTNLTAYTKDEKGFDKGFDVDSIIDHARQLTFFGNKNRTRMTLEDMKIMDKKGNVINQEFKALNTRK